MRLNPITILVSMLYIWIFIWYVRSYDCGTTRYKVIYLFILKNVKKRNFSMTPLVFIICGGELKR